MREIDDEACRAAVRRRNENSWHSVQSGMVDEESIKYAIIKKSLFLVIDDSLKNVGIY